VRVVAREGAVTLMERAAGPDLSGMALSGQDDAATGIICDVVGALHRSEAVAEGLIPMPERGAELRAALARGLVPEGARGMMSRAADLLAELCADRAGWRMLHGDIHHFNVLASPRGWLAIDPKGLWGPGVYDYANTLCNPFPHVGHVADPVRMARQADIIAERAGVDRGLLLRWTFVHAAMGTAWSLGTPEADYGFGCQRVAGALAGERVPG
jgi:streptomycin 6-kinase